MQLKRINISISVDKKTNADQIVDTIEQIIIGLRNKKILTEPFTKDGATVDDSRNVFKD